MKILIIGGNRFVGLRLSILLDNEGHDLSIVNRTGQVAHVKNAAIYKSDRTSFAHASLDRDWDVVVDFACFNETDARDALAFFRNVKRYIFISTLSVNDLGADLNEDAFNPAGFDLARPTYSGSDRGLAYQDGKRRAEAVFTQQTRMPVHHIRFPVILGPDDYTRRLEFHVERIERQRPLHLPDLKARISMVHAEDAAAFLHWDLTQDFEGPLNVASPAPIRMSDLIKQIERACGAKALLLKEPAGDAQSPYGPTGDYFLNVGRMQRYGFETHPIETWLPDLIEGARGKPPRAGLH